MIRTARTKHLLFTVALLLMSAAATFAQEEAAAEAQTAPPGIGLFLLLGGLGAIALVGYITSRREASNTTDS